MVGRVDLLHQVSRGSAHLDDLDLNPMLIMVDGAKEAQLNRSRNRTEVDDTLDIQVINDAARFFQYGEKMQLSYAVKNTDRTIGTRASSHVVNKFGMNNELQSNQLTLKLTGSAGQSLGAFLVSGIKIEVTGESNDYVGKGLSGGMITIKPHVSSLLIPHKNTIIGNTVLYGATDGKLFASGRAGERFAVRNSGAHVVIEGCGTNGCEYMTGGVAVILGSIGSNFGAGMTGGMAYVYDPQKIAKTHINLESLVIADLSVNYWVDQLKVLIEEHVRETGSVKGSNILDNWEIEKMAFLQICPKEMLTHIPFPILLNVDETSVGA